MKKFLKDLEAELKKNNLSEEEINEILADHQEMIESAIKEGLSDEELEAKFGDPVEVAKELADFSDKEEEEEVIAKQTGDTLEFSEVKENYNVNIGLINEDVKVCIHEKDSIIVEWQGRINLKDYRINFRDNTLNLTRKNEIGIRSYFERNSKKKFVIYVPKAKKIDDFRLKIVNGDGVIKNIFSSEFKIGTNNGDFKIKEVTTGKININSVNADLVMEAIECDDFKLSLVSGDIEAKKINVKNDFTVNTVSGDMDIEDSECDNFRIRTVSGDIKAKEFYPKEISLTTVSGDIVIVNSQEKEMKINRKKSVSGDIKIKIKN